MPDDPTTRKGFKRSLQQLFDDSKKESSSFTDHLNIERERFSSDLEDARSSLSEADVIKDEIKKKQDTVNSQASEVKNTYTEFKDLTKNINSKNSGVAAKLKKIEESRDNSALAEEEAGKHRDQALLIEKKISEIKDSANQKGEKIDKILNDSNDIKDEIQKTYKIATDLGLAGALFNRKNQLNMMVAIWMAIFLLACAGTVFIIWHMLPHLEGVKTINVYLSKALFVTPTFLIAVFAFNQFKHERKLLEGYSFRAAMAQSLESYTTLLSKEFSDEKYKQQLLDFTLGSMRDIYDKNSIEVNKTFTRFFFKSHVAEVEATIKEEANNINQNIKGVTAKVAQLEDNISEK